MIRDEIRQLSTGRRELRKFGLMVGGVFAVLGILFLLRGKAYGPPVLAAGTLLVIFGVLWPTGLKHIYIAWMSLAIVLGFIVSTLILTLFFFFVITPIGLVARMVGKDFLGLKLKPGQQTYWISRERKAKTPAQYEQQF